MINKDVATISIGSEGLSGRTSWGYHFNPKGAGPHLSLSAPKTIYQDI